MNTAVILMAQCVALDLGLNVARANTTVGYFKRQWGYNAKGRYVAAVPRSSCCSPIYFCRIRAARACMRAAAAYGLSKGCHASQGAGAARTLILALDLLNICSKASTWDANTPVHRHTIVQYNGAYYKAEGWMNTAKPGSWSAWLYWVCPVPPSCTELLCVLLHVPSPQCCCAGALGRRVT